MSTHYDAASRSSSVDRSADAALPMKSDRPSGSVLHNGPIVDEATKTKHAVADAVAAGSSGAPPPGTMPGTTPPASAALSLTGAGSAGGNQQVHVRPLTGKAAAAQGLTLTPAGVIRLTPVNPGAVTLNKSSNLDDMIDEKKKPLEGPTTTGGKVWAFLKTAGKVIIGLALFPAGLGYISAKITVGPGTFEQNKGVLLEKLRQRGSSERTAYINRVEKEIVDKLLMPNTLVKGTQAYQNWRNEAIATFATKPEAYEYLNPQDHLNDTVSKKRDSIATTQAAINKLDPVADKKEIDDLKIKLKDLEGEKDTALAELDVKLQRMAREEGYNIQPGVLGSKASSASKVGSATPSASSGGITITPAGKSGAAKKSAAAKKASASVLGSTADALLGSKRTAELNAKVDAAVADAGAPPKKTQHAAGTSPLHPPTDEEAAKKKS